MKKFLLNLSLIVAVSLISLQISAQSFSANYNFQSVVSGQNGRIDPTPVPTATGVTFGSFSAVGNMSANPNAGKRFSFTGWPLGATNGSDVFTGSLDATQYYEVTITPAPYYSTDLSSVVFTVQRSSTGIRQYAVRSSVDGYANNLPASIDPANVNLSVVDVNVFQIADAATSAQVGSKVTLSNGFTGITAPVTFRFYGFNAEASGGTFSLNSVTFDGSATISPTAPNIIINPTSLSFASVQANAVSGPLTFTVEGDNLTDPVTLTTNAPFSLSDAENGAYGTTLSLNPGDVTSAKTIYVKFSPDIVGGYNGTVSLSSTDAITQSLNLLGQAIDPANLTFDFNSCVNTGVPGEGWTTYSVEGPSQTWTCTTFGRNMTNGVNINGYSGGPLENEDWLISPPLEISSMSLLFCDSGAVENSQGQACNCGYLRIIQVQEILTMLRGLI